jgi:hypothetical protein
MTRSKGLRSERGSDAIRERREAETERGERATEAEAKERMKRGGVGVRRRGCSEEIKDSIKGGLLRRENGEAPGLKVHYGTFVQ